MTPRGMTLLYVAFAIACAVASGGAVPDVNGPWQLELVAEAPDIRHPSVVCSGPDGRVFVAEDPMDITVPADARQGRIICFHPNGRRTVFAEGLYAVFGMQYLEGRLYVLHNPEFTAFVDGGDRAIGSELLIERTNPNPWALDWNDHVPANFKLAMDGYFYIAVGDKGIYGAKGKDGRQVFLHGGGILRMRPDGTGLEIYCTGVRNILDVALTREDEIFTYDNTDEHDWMGRLTHMVEGGFYGYPHDFIPRRPYTLWMMHDFGGGAATGAFAYTGDALPASFEDNLFLADFGKRQVLRVEIGREGATFKVVRHEEMFANMPDDFRPVGIAPSADGKSIFICDWQHRDVKGTNVVGRLWKLSYKGATREKARPAWYVPLALGKRGNVAETELAQGLRHSDKAVRLTAQRELTRRRAVDVFAEVLAGGGVPEALHAVWGLATLGWEGTTVRPPQDSRVLAHLIRAGLARPSDHLANPDASVRFQAATALGRNASEPDGLPTRLDDPDPFVRYAAFHALNRIGRRNSAAWKAIVAELNRSKTAAYALRETWDLTLLDELSAFVRDRANSPPSRVEATGLMAAMARKFPEWKGEWWAYHPALAAPPKKTLPWEGTARVHELIQEISAAPEKELRLAAVRAIGVIGEKELAAHLRGRFDVEPDTAVKRAILETLGELGDPGSGPMLAQLLREGPDELRLPAIRAARGVKSSAVEHALAGLLVSRPGNELRAEIIQTLGVIDARSSVDLIATEAASPEAEVRSAAIKALGRLGGEKAVNRLRQALRHGSLETKYESLAALTQLKDASAIPDLLEAWKAPETREAALDGILRFSDRRALHVYLEALGSSNPGVRARARKALQPFRADAWPLVKEQVRELKPLVVAELKTIFPEEQDWILLDRGSVVPSNAEYTVYALQNKGDAVRGKALFFNESGVACARCHTVEGRGNAVGPDLTSIGTQFPRAALIEHIIAPSKSVREGYQQVQIETEDDEIISGLIKAESADDLTVLDGQARMHTIPKRKITRRHSSELSLMPEGLHLGLSLEEFADLLAYLETLKGGTGTLDRQDRD